NVKAVIVACGIVHNFIRDFDSSDLGDDFESEEEDTDDDGVGDGEIAFDFHNGTSWRTWMASAMWREYQEFRQSAPDNSASGEGSASESETADNEVETEDSTMDERFSTSDDDSESARADSSEDVAFSDEEFMSDASW
ncbi:hypothetical protein PHMEG_00019854, partial [Phytophthora megakarya]